MKSKFTVFLIFRTFSFKYINQNSTFFLAATVINVNSKGIATQRSVTGKHFAQYAIDGNSSTYSYCPHYKFGYKCWFKIVFYNTYFIKYIEVKTQKFTVDNADIKVGTEVKQPQKNALCAKLITHVKDLVRYSCKNGIVEARLVFIVRTQYNLQLYDVNVLALHL